MRFRLLLLVCVIGAVGATAQTRESDPRLSFPPLKSERTSTDSFFDANGRPAPLRILHDFIGLVPRDGVETQRLLPLAEKFGLRLEREYPRQVLVFRLSQPLPRPQLVELARRVRRESDGVIAYAGMVVLPGTSEVPFLVTDEIVANFRGGIEEAEKVAKEYDADVIRDPLSRTRAILVLRGDPSRDAIHVANALHKNAAEWAHPNFVRVVIYRQVIPNDPRFGDQWHHQNAGASGGTVDGDVDTPLAWAITRGSAATIIAVIDNAVQITHPDLQPNLWVNAGETAGNSVDDDGDGFVDDVNGWDFFGDDGNPAPGASDDHGTAVAGVAAARGDNTLGVAGACLECALMSIRQGSTVADDGQAFDFARLRGAHVITNSWGYAIGTPLTAVVVTAINDAATTGRGGLGCVVLFAMNNGDVNDCSGATPDISSIANVIAVSASSNQEQKVTESAWGNCMDVIAPTHRGYGDVAFTGTLNIVTTDRTGDDGYNDTNPVGSCPAIPAEPSAGDGRDYTVCFGGTSSATPLAAGLAGLIVNAAPTLTRLQVQQLLQDTADKMQDATGAYSNATAFSAPASGNATHGYGRVNGFEAVRVAAPAGVGGRAGIDVFIRDNRLDWGNTEQPSNVTFEPARGFIPHYQSVDIKVDTLPHQPAPTTNAAFEAFVDENPRSNGADNRVYVRVRNRGPSTAAAVNVKLHWAFAGTALPALPADFWSTFPADSSDVTVWHPLGTMALTDLAYSGASVAGSGGDAAQILVFTFPGPPFDSSAAAPHHYCLLAVVDSPQDPALPISRPTVGGDFIPDVLTPIDNNVTHRNLFLEDASRFRSMRFLVRNPSAKEARIRILLDTPERVGAKLSGVPVNQWFSLGPGKEILVTLRATRKQPGRVFVTQETEASEGFFRGGLVLDLQKPKKK